MRFLTGFHSCHPQCNVLFVYSALCDYLLRVRCLLMLTLRDLTSRLLTFSTRALQASFVVTGIARTGAGPVGLGKLIPRTLGIWVCVPAGQ